MIASACTSRRGRRAAALVAVAFLELSFASEACTHSASTRADVSDDAAAPETSPGFAAIDGGGFPADASLAVEARYVLGGCGGGPEAACHAPGRSVSGLTLPDSIPSNLVDVPSTEEPDVMRILPGDPARSYLYWKITGSPAIDGGRMPMDLPPLDDQSIAAIARWIEAGAPR